MISSPIFSDYKRGRVAAVFACQAKDQLPKMKQVPARARHLRGKAALCEPVARVALNVLMVCFFGMLGCVRPGSRRRARPGG